MAGENLTAYIGSGLQEGFNVLLSLLGIIIGIAGISIIFWIVSLIINRKKNKVLEEILENLKSINKKIDKIK